MPRKSPPAPVLDEYDLVEMMSGFPHLEAAARRRKAQLGERPQRRRKLREAEVLPVDPDTPEGFARILSGEVDLPAPQRDTASLEWFLEQFWV
jgi:hypothetical protein